MSVKNAAPWLVRMSMMVPTLAAPAPACQPNVAEKSPGLIGKLSKAVGHMDQELNVLQSGDGQCCREGSLTVSFM